MSRTDGEETPTLEERVAVLESRVDDLASQQDHSNGLAVIAAREALTARQAHQQNVELLNALRKTQAEHTKTLAEHSQRFVEHGQRLDAIEGRLDDIQGTLGTVTVGMHTIEGLLRQLTDDETSG